MYNLLPPPLDTSTYKIHYPLLSTAFQEVFKMVSSSTALTVAQVCPRDIFGADSSTLSEQFLPVQSRSRGDYGMLKKA
jgi:hypothetical protein